MNNKQIKKDIQKIYNPETVFGNPEVIKLIKQIKVPNDDGNFETVGDSIVKIIGVKWECVNCGSYNKDEITELYSGYENVETQCKKCKAKHLVEVEK